MESDRSLPQTLAEWARRQGRDGVRHTTATTLWEGADAVMATILPVDATPLSWDWPLIRDLIDAYVSGLPSLAVGDRVRPVEPDAHVWREGTVVAVYDSRVLRVRADHVTPDAGRMHTFDAGRIRVEPIPSVYFTATIITLDGSDTIV